MKTKLFAITVICLLASSIARAEQHSKDVQVQDLIKHYAGEMINKYSFDVPKPIKKLKPDNLSIGTKELHYNYLDHTQLGTNWHDLDNLSIQQEIDNGHRELIIYDDQIYFKLQKKF